MSTNICVSTYTKQINKANLEAAEALGGIAPSPLLGSRCPSVSIISRVAIKVVGLRPAALILIAPDIQMISAALKYV